MDLKVTEYEDCIGIEFNQAYLVVDKDNIDELCAELAPFKTPWYRRLFNGRFYKSGRKEQSRSE